MPALPLDGVGCGAGLARQGRWADGWVELRWQPMPSAEEPTSVLVYSEVKGLSCNLTKHSHNLWFCKSGIKCDLKNCNIYAL